MAETAASLRKDVDRLAPLEALTGDLQRECSRLHDTSDMCAHTACLPAMRGRPSLCSTASIICVDVVYGISWVVQHTTSTPAGCGLVAAAIYL